MKKLKSVVAGIMALGMCLAINPINASATTTTYKQGDINGDGVVNVNDLGLIRQFLNGQKGANKTIAEKLDVNTDYVIDECDYKYVQDIILHKKTSVTKYVNTDNISDLPQQEDRQYCVFNTNGVQIDSYYLYKEDAPKITNSSISTTNLIDGESRVQENGLKGVVKLTYSTGQGTGFVIDEHTILTAGHCMYDEANNKGVNNIKIHFYDDYDTENVSFSNSITSYQIPYKYVSNFNSNYDYALITVSYDLSAYINFNVGVIRDEIDTNNPQIYVTGFGSAGRPVDQNEVNPDFIGNKSTDWNYLWSTPVTDYFVQYKADQVPGNSGGPVYICNSDGTKTVIGIAAYSHLSSLYNYGPRITTDILQFIYQHHNY